MMRIIITFYDGDKVHVLYDKKNAKDVDKIVSGKKLWESICG